jgi:hypothetical protein
VRFAPETQGTVDYALNDSSDSIGRETAVARGAIKSNLDLCSSGVVEVSNMSRSLAPCFGASSSCAARVEKLVFSLSRSSAQRSTSLGIMESAEPQSNLVGGVDKGGGTLEKRRSLQLARAITCSPMLGLLDGLFFFPACAGLKPGPFHYRPFL